MTSTQHINITDINLSLQFRKLDEETIADYVAALQEKTELPDVTVALDRETNIYYMVDGFHRLDAHKRCNATMITANVETMPKKDALWLALGANARNGRRLSNEDKRNAIALALTEFPNASSRAIAVHVGCSHQLVIDCKESGCQTLTPEPTPLLDAEVADEPDEDNKSEPKTKPERVTGTDGKSYPATKTAKDKPMASFGELTKSLPYSYAEQQAAQAIEDSLFALPGTLTVQVRGEYLVVTSTDPDKPPLRTIPLQRGTDWQNYPPRPFFKFSAADWDILENGGIRTVGDLAKLISTDPKEQKTLPKFGKKKIEHLEKQFEKFWAAHPELCQS